MINILGIDTSSKVCEVSLKMGDKYKVMAVDEGLVHSEKLLPMIDQISKKNGLKIKDINKIVVNIGPGSFTGIRVGVSVSRAIAQILDIEIYGVVGLDVFMYKFLKNSYNRDKIVVLLDALRGEFYGAIYDHKGKLELDYQILKKADIDFSDKVLVDTTKNLGEDLIKFVEFSGHKSQTYQNIKPFYMRKTAAEEKKQKHAKI